MARFVKSAVAIAVAICLTVPLFAKDETFKVEFSIEELAFSINVLNSMDIIGEEVQPFMDIKNVLMDVYKEVSGGKKKSGDVNFTLPMAKNFLFFMQRGRFKGVDAAIFNNISTKMIEAIKKESK
ncbi:MAG TPA: hypothetical protein P5105_06810 [Victivallales bacterium]|jgi:hypothetical protein|nr:hypothetical protein [Bacteroidales bacterium]HRR06978.1 hypothetical protein [Victivallales bacterium]HRR29627.1 hypothetical protein [Victivallales bacterium]